MLFLRIINFLRGYVVICAEGVFIERFINICLRRNLLLWEIKKTGKERMVAKMTIDAFFCIRPIARRTRTKVRITGREGLPFIIHRYRKRKLALTGIVLFITLLWYTSGHIMGITIYGNERISTENILSVMAEQGISAGAPISRLDRDYLHNRLISEIDELAWVGINRKGSRIYVEVVERLNPKPKVAKETPCNLVAENDGIIESIYARSGQTMVKVGEGVKKGEVLVSGIVDNGAMGFRLLHAYGDVYATTTYTATREYPLEYQEKEYTGKDKKRFKISILGYTIPLSLSTRQPFEVCEENVTQNTYTPPVDLLPSITFISTDYKEQTLVPKSRTEAEIIEIAKEELEAELKASLPDDAEIKDTQIKHFTTEFGTVMVTVTLTCRENISAENIIDKNAQVDYDRSGILENAPPLDFKSKTEENQR